MRSAEGSSTGGLPPLEDLLPHRGPMLLLEGLLEANLHRVLCSLQVRPQSSFCEHGYVPPVIALEYMAQAASVLMGIRRRHAKVPRGNGYLLGTRRLQLMTPRIASGSELLIEAVCEFDDGKLGSFRCLVTCSAQPIAKAQISAYESDEESL